MGRGNILLQYKGSSEKSISFVGSHLDVVPANPEEWDRPPFELVEEGDRLYGRGTTDCLGHVALVTCLFLELAKQKPDLAVTVNAVLIASEEATCPGVGIDELMNQGRLSHLKNGPIIWVDCADSQPCIGTAAAMPWHLEFTGKLFHSGLPHKAINSLEFGMEALAQIQKRFYEDFPELPEDKEWNFACPSSMKPTQISVPKGGINQTPGYCKISGDVRLTPFYKPADVKTKVAQYVADLQANLNSLPTRGVGRYELPDENIVGKISLEWGECLGGIACKRDSDGYRALRDAIALIKGKAEPYAICGSLPLVDQLAEAGFDVQLTGFGLSSTYHALNEYANFSDMADGFKILATVIESMNKAV